ncbi:hypothetical protein F4780DRAFT_470297 [Xylariomycetidae sp. FL0641]|nr:hypothetical protein F4780DRAFT_470297 [Xylariomycetidae sp. FL0641]
MENRGFRRGGTCNKSLRLASGQSSPAVNAIYLWRGATDGEPHEKRHFLIITNPIEVLATTVRAGAAISNALTLVIPTRRNLLEKPLASWAGNHPSHPCFRGSCSAPGQSRQSTKSSLASPAKQSLNELDELVLACPSSPYSEPRIQIDRTLCQSARSQLGGSLHPERRRRCTADDAIVCVPRGSINKTTSGLYVNAQKTSTAGVSQLPPPLVARMK